MDDGNGMWPRDNDFYREGSKLHPNRERGGLGSSRFWQIIAISSLVLLVIFAGIITYLLVNRSPGTPGLGTNTNTPQPRVTSPPVIKPTATPIPPTATPIPPTDTPTPIPTPSLPCTVNVGTWTGGSSDWKTLNGMLLNDGTRGMGTGQNGPTIVAPCQLGGIADYAVEAKIQVISTASYQGGTCFGITVRGSSNANSWQGYQADIDIDGCSYQGGSARILGAQFPNDLSLTYAPFNPGKIWHVYKVEVKGNNIKIFTDGSLLVQVNDNQYLSGEQVGLWSYGVQLNVSSFKVTAL